MESRRYTTLTALSVADFSTAPAAQRKKLSVGRVLGGIRLAGVLLSASVLPHSFLSASKIFSDGRNKDIPID